MNAVLIPLSVNNQRFQIPLSNVRLGFTVIWRNRGGAGWVLDLSLEDETPLVSGLPLVTGHDILEQHRHLGIPGRLILLGEPTFTNLGTDDCQLYYVTD